MSATDDLPLGERTTVAERAEAFAEITGGHGAAGLDGQRCTADDAYTGELSRQT